MDDILHFWRDKRDTLPIMAHVARKVLAVPASSAASERLFSLAGRTIDERRSLLSAEHVNQLMLVKSNVDLLPEGKRV